MKSIRTIGVAMALGSGALMADTAATFTNFIRQVQLPSGVQWDASVAASGEQQSSLEINPGGARFELWTVKSTPLTNYLLDSKYVGSYVPIGQVVIRSEDPYAIIPRTRADRPFYVDLTVSGLLSDAGAPAAAKSVNFLHHKQSYGTGGTGVGIDRTTATLISTSSIAANGSQTLTYALTALTATPQTKVRGEERFSLYSLDDYQAPADLLASQFIQIWPVQDGSLSGITSGQLVRFACPVETITLNDLYPKSTTYCQIYQGAAALGKTGLVVPGSSLVLNETVPQSRVLTLSNWDKIFTADGVWTMELVTSTPFGVERLAYVTFTLDRTIQVIGNVTTISD